ncbi:MAG: nucleoside monophosphate kinase [Candidatus Aenigmarchaeota archaeon]|nr:nucleoside monophosphate kinase [Candidatus Aenigmarchaeota archaeon]
MQIIIMGPQGSGKGTQAEMLARELGIRHVCTGDLLREMAQKDAKIKEAIDRGELLPPEIVIPLVRKNLMECRKGFVLDGAPRNTEQAQMLGIHIDHVIYLDIPDKKVIERLSSRLQCMECRAIYGKDMPPKVQGKCDKCGSELRHRDDDNPETIRKRLKVFHEETEKVMKYYERKRLLRKVDASGKPEEVFERILKAIKPPARL